MSLVVIAPDGTSVPTVRYRQVLPYRWETEVAWPCRGGWIGLRERRWSLRRAEQAAQRLVAAGRPGWMP